MRRATGFIIAAYFLALTWDALHSYFSLDDLMNLSLAWGLPLRDLLRATLLFWQNSEIYRPLGGLWYRTIFHFAGFNPLPFHLANLVVLGANIWITYALVARLASREAAAIAAIFVAFHSRFASLYLDTGFVYDVLAYFFYFSCFLIYVIASRGPKVGVTIVCLLLTIAALISKEIAATLPLTLAAYELVYHRKWKLHDLTPWLAITALTCFFTISRFAHSSLLNNGAYRPTFTIERFLATTRNFMSDLFHAELPTAIVILIWLALLAIAWIAKQPALRFAFAFLTLAPLPVAFIAPRGASRYYIPLFGWALFAAVAIVKATERYVSPRVVFAVIALVSYIGYRGTAWATDYGISVEGELNRSLAKQMLALHPSLPKGARVLFLDPPFDRDQDAWFLFQLLYRDRDLAVDRVKSAAADRSKFASYDAAVSYRNGRLRPAQQADQPEPAIVFEMGRPQIFHSDFTLVTLQHPARAGEAVIAKATDLGPTDPPVPAGQPFPNEPLLPIAGPVQVRIDGRLVESWDKIGWPQTINEYRVDFKIPKPVRASTVSIDVAAGGIRGPAVSIPVRR